MWWRARWGTFSIAYGKKVQRLRLSDCVVFFDFDNTITQFDVICDVLKRFSVDQKWVPIEHAWQAGRIGSKECLKSQLRSVRRTKKEMRRYLWTVPIDPYFRPLVELLRKNRVRPVILSDSFSFFIKEILRNHGIKGVGVHCNEVRFSGNRLIPSFPYPSKGCPRCAHCKKQHLLDNRWRSKITVYIGDGLSDVCPARQADLLFAKDHLLDYCRKNEIPCIPFKNLRDVRFSLRRRFR